MSSRLPRRLPVETAPTFNCIPTFTAEELDLCSLLLPSDGEPVVTSPGGVLDRTTAKVEFDAFWNVSGNKSVAGTYDYKCWILPFGSRMPPWRRWIQDKVAGMGPPGDGQLLDTAVVGFDWRYVSRSRGG